MVVERQEALMKKEEEKEDYREEVMAMEDKLQEKVTQKENMKQMKRGRKKKSECKLLSYEELPEYMKENEFIRRYYRSERPISHAFLSLFSWHNETLNAWTHLLGFLLFFALMMLQFNNKLQLAPMSFASKRVENVSLSQGILFSVTPPLINRHQAAKSGEAAPRWPFMVFLAGAAICLLTSSLCHLLCCHSRRLNLLLSRLDYAGIATMIAASFFPPISYAFLCSPWWSLLYLSAISSLAVAAVVSLLSPARAAHRGFRAMLFAGMGLTGAVPAVHIAVAYWSEERRSEVLAWEAAMAGLYLMGTGFYVSRVPERWRPGKYDLAGNSHQIFHVLVVAGALAHYAAALLFLEWRDEAGCGRR